MFNQIMKKIIKIILSYLKCVICGVKYVEGVTIAPNVKIVNGENLILGRNCHLSQHSKICCFKGSKVFLRKNSWMHPYSRIQAHNNSTVILENSSMLDIDSMIYAMGGSSITLGEGTILSKYSIVTAKNKVTIGNNVLMGPKVFISDYNHDYRDINLPINKQGLYNTNKDGKSSSVYIGDGSWIGTNVVIVGDIKIGNHCVIGANSTVVNDIPDYSVAVGNPAKVKKIYNFETNKWEKSFE